MLKKYKIIKKSKLGDLNESLKKLRLKLDFLRTINSNSYDKIIDNLDLSKSQFLQDLFVLNTLNFKRDGYFIEFGATNGIDLSNSYLLEKKFNWKGILAEPSRNWHKELKANRTSHVDTECVWKKSGEKLLFLEADIGEYSTLSKTANYDKNFHKRKRAKKYDVETISLNDLLLRYKAPTKIDYLSIDTEGSEFEILENFDFSKYDIKVVTCEHNYTSNREKIFSLMSKNGYKRVYQEISQCDDWYVKI